MIDVTTVPIGELLAEKTMKLSRTRYLLNWALEELDDEECWDDDVISEFVAAIRDAVEGIDDDK